MLMSLAKDVWQLPLWPRHGINAYLVGDVLVDTGVKPSEATIAEMLGSRRISAIALTHAHGDHAGSLKALAARYGVPVWCGEADREAVQSGSIVVSGLLSRRRLKRRVQAAVGFDGVPVARTLSEGDELAAGFTVLDVPGHSPGHVAFWRESDRTLIAGDVFLNMSFATTVPGLHQPPAALTPDPELNRRSERRLAALRPTRVGFGHGPVLVHDAADELERFVATLS